MERRMDDGSEDAAPCSDCRFGAANGTCMGGGGAGSCSGRDKSVLEVGCPIDVSLPGTADATSTRLYVSLSLSVSLCLGLLRSFALLPGSNKKHCEKVSTCGTFADSRPQSVMSTGFMAPETGF